MTCEEMQSLLVGYESDELVPAQREFVALHLEQCPCCRAVLAGLQMTRHQLQQLRVDTYQPDLTLRISTALARRRAMANLGRWLGMGARMVATAAAALVLALVLQGGWPGAHSPAAPPPATIFLAAAERLTIQGTEAQQEVALPEGSTLLGITPDGRTAWLLRDIEGLAFGVDRLDLSTGALEPDLIPKPGRARSGALSQDGRHLYVVASVQGETYLKRIDPDSRSREEATLVPNFPAEAAVLHAGDRVYLAAVGMLATIRGSAVRVTPVAGLTSAATISPDGRRLASAPAGGGVLLVDPASGRVMLRTDGPIYQELAYGPSGHLYAAAGATLEIRAGRRLQPAGRVSVPNQPVNALVIR